MLTTLSTCKRKCYIFIVIWIVSAGLIFAPLLFPALKHRVSTISKIGSFGHALRTSVLLKIFEGVSIGSTLPSLVNSFLDKISYSSNKSQIGSHYVTLLFMFATGVVYLSYYEEDFISYFYASSFGLKLEMVWFVGIYFVSNGVVATQQKMNFLLFLLPTICFAALQVFISFQLLFPTSEVISAIRIPLYCSSVFFFYLCGFVWSYNFRRQYRINNYLLGFEEKKELIHMCTIWVFSVAFMVANGLDNPSNNVWVDTSETILIVYCLLYVAAIIFLTIMPNRLLRTISDIQGAALRMKREFVRYVSHEIRSPLNVAFAGLEILKAELEVIGVSSFVRELMEDIHFANNTAIDILNDMLQYEHIDSGTFKLDMAVMPLLDAFRRRLGAYRFMASKKNICLSIEDHVGVSEFYGTDDVELANHFDDPEDENARSVYSVLYIDKFRVEQVVRNLVSNAIKFTPEGGTITMRFLRLAAAADPSASKHPVHDLEDDSVLKQAESYLRIEVIDSGAGAYYVLSTSYMRSVYVCIHVCMKATCASK